MRKIIHVCCLLIAGLCALPAAAECLSYNTSFTINAGTITVQRDSSVGTPLSDILYGQEQQTYTCASIQNGGSGLYSALPATGGQASGNAVFDTGLPGIGIAMGYKGGFTAGQWSNWILAGTNWRSAGTWSGGGAWFFTYQPMIQFIKTSAAAQSGPTGSMLIGYFQPRDDSVGVIAPQIPIYLNAYVNALTCSVTTPTLAFPIGDIPASSFGTAVGITPAEAQSTQNLKISCNPGTNINITLVGTQNPDSADNTILALNGQGSTGVAEGVGVQLLYNSIPLAINTILPLKQSAGGAETFPIVARYYQTKTTIRAGTANASATLNLTYQ